MIRLGVPGTLEYRDVAMRVVASACKLLRPSDDSPSPDSAEGLADVSSEEFDHQVVSAFGEVFNNLAMHGYGGGREGKNHDSARAGATAVGLVEIEIAAEADALLIRVRDTGLSFEFPDNPEAPESLPERGMGLFIIQSFMDSVEYTPGNGPNGQPSSEPNVLTLRKHWPSRAGAATAGNGRPTGSLG